MYLILKSNPFKKIAFVILFGLSGYVYGQTNDEFFGNGNTTGITVTSSDNAGDDISSNSIKGETYIFDEAQAVRFLQQSTLGYNYEDVQHLNDIGIENWITEQMNLTQNGLFNEYYELRDFSSSIGADLPNHTDGYIGYTFYNKVINDEEQLRLKTAFALSQILVLSFDTDVTDRMSDSFTDFFDIFYEQAFGNFRDILFDVTVHKTMGLYLSYIGNKKEDPSTGTFPDENFAREVMQLFTIGLFELNNDGTHKLDDDGNSIPTYDNDDIVQLAKVFTGLTDDRDTFIMAFEEEDHDVGEKIMIDGTVLPVNQSVLQDVNAALDVLFNHENTGPFICTNLIKQMVKSNPTPAYVDRVATVFNNNGQGERGDMEAVIKAILLDTEARDCIWMNNTSSGRLLQPIEKFMLLFKALKVSTSSNRMYITDFRIWDNQRILGSPTVFNFFSPFYSEPEIVAPAGLVSPEFEIFNSVGSIQYYNNINSVIKNPGGIQNYTVSNDNGDGLADNRRVDPLTYDLSFEENLYETQGVEALVDHYNLLLCRNQLTESMQLIIENTITEYQENERNYSSRDAVTDVVLFMVTSPVFNILN